jgi:hypothetical protein
MTIEPWVCNRCGSHKTVNVLDSAKGVHRWFCEDCKKFFKYASAMSQSDYCFLRICGSSVIPKPVRDFVVVDGHGHWSFGWPDYCVVVDVCKKVERSLVKVNYTSLLGWKVFLFTPQHFESGYALDTLIKFFALANEYGPDEKIDSPSFQYYVPQFRGWEAVLPHAKGFTKKVFASYHDALRWAEGRKKADPSVRIIPGKFSERWDVITHHGNVLKFYSCHAALKFCRGVALCQAAASGSGGGSGAEKMAGGLPVTGAAGSV